MSKAASQRIALVLNQEITAVVTALRQNAKWAMVPTRYTVALSHLFEVMSVEWLCSTPTRAALLVPAGRTDT